MNFMRIALLMALCGSFWIPFIYPIHVAADGTSDFFYKDQRRVTLTSVKDIEVDVSEFVKSFESLRSVESETECYVPETWEENLNNESLKAQVAKCNSYLNYSDIEDLLVLDANGNFKTSDTKFEWGTSYLDPPEVALVRDCSYQKNNQKVSRTCYLLRTQYAPHPIKASEAKFRKSLLISNRGIEGALSIGKVIAGLTNEQMNQLEGRLKETNFSKSQGYDRVDLRLFGAIGALFEKYMLPSFEDDQLVDDIGKRFEQIGEKLAGQKEELSKEMPWSRINSDTRDLVLAVTHTATEFIDKDLGAMDKLYLTMSVPVDASYLSKKKGRYYLKIPKGRVFSTNYVYGARNFSGIKLVRDVKNFITSGCLKTILKPDVDAFIGQEAFDKLTDTLGSILSKFGVVLFSDITQFMPLENANESMEGFGCEKTDSAVENGSQNKAETNSNAHEFSGLEMKRAWTPSMIEYGDKNEQSSEQDPRDEEDEKNGRERNISLFMIGPKNSVLNSGKAIEVLQKSLGGYFSVQAPSSTNVIEGPDMKEVWMKRN